MHFYLNIKKELNNIDTVKTNRTRYIGGSDIPALFNKSTFKTYQELVKQYVLNKTIEIDSLYADYGTLMEPKIRDYFNKEYDFNFKPQYMTNEKHRIRCNCDGLDEKEKAILEIKTNNGKHNNKIDYELQIQLYLWVFECDKAYLVEYERPTNFYDYEKKEYDLSFDEDNVTVSQIIKNKEMIDLILKEVYKFWLIVDKLRKKKGIR